MTTHKDLKGKLLKVYDIQENNFICICIESYYDFHTAEYTHVVLTPSNVKVRVSSYEYHYKYKILS